MTLHAISPSPTIEYRRQWIGLLTVPNQEQKAANWLIRISWKSPTEVYWPKKIQRVPGKIQSNGCRGQVHRPRSIFPGMMFASIAVDDIPGYSPFNDFKATPGIRGYLRNGQGYPSALSEHDMVTIMMIETRENAPEVPIEPRKFKVGDRVRLTDDLMDRLPPGVIVGFRGDSLEIEINGLLGQATKMVLRPQQVEAV
jgi:transcription antitermination factor NusG